MAVGAGGSERALEDELMILAGFEAVFVEEGGKSREFHSAEDCFDGAALRTAADEGAIGAFAEDEVECADDDRFSRAGFAGDGVVAGGEIQGEVRDQGEILDAERGQHRRIKANVAVGARKKNGRPHGRRWG